MLMRSAPRTTVRKSLPAFMRLILIHSIQSVRRHEHTSVRSSAESRELDQRIEWARPVLSTGRGGTNAVHYRGDFACAVAAGSRDWLHAGQFHLRPAGHGAVVVRGRAGQRSSNGLAVSEVVGF